MFGVPLETIVKGHDNYKYRPFGKVAELACGFQGGAGALEAMDSKRGIDPEEYPRLVRQWCDANPNIRKLWYAAEEAAVRAVTQKTTVKLKHGVQYRYAGGILFADLPSGRSLAYVQPQVQIETIRPPGKDPFEKECLSFWGMDQVKKHSCPFRSQSIHEKVDLYFGCLKSLLLVKARFKRGREIRGF
ncbi:hypothetical protein NYE40_00670 [Paenibacillus sp. FSL W8-1187]|uniref:hypothetical protein n=1 Tax=Paenibacillus sp. FSL W8-1187 TaxID=2975339 RepID=UPI0030D7107A